jgi:CheY-like chemotaxis protein
VEDNDSVRDALLFVLQRDGHHVATARNGTAALRMLQSEDYDLIVTDVLMPGMDGIELIRELRGRPGRPRVIAMSGGGHAKAADYLAIALHLGADATLAKPVSTPELRDEISRVMMME